MRKPGSSIATVHTYNPPKRSRSPGYDAEIAKTICLRLINRESLRSICADPRMPAKATVCRWLARNQEFRRWYALARAWQVEDFANEILEIVDDCSDIRHARHRIGALRLAIARMTPRKYGNP
jgi:hypothetical protein